MTNYRPRLIHWVIAAILILLTALPARAEQPDKVLLCHATGSETNPYVLIEVPPSAVENAHIDRETGNLHGDQLGNRDFIVQEGETCVTPTPTPTPTSSTSSSPTPSPGGSAPAEPTPSPTGTSTAIPSLPDTAVLTGSGN